MTCSVPGSRFNDSHWGNTAGAGGQRAGHGRPVGPGLAASAKQADMVRILPVLPALSSLHGALMASVMPTVCLSIALSCCGPCWCQYLLSCVSCTCYGKWDCLHISQPLLHQPSWAPTKDTSDHMCSWMCRWRMEHRTRGMRTAHSNKRMERGCRTVRGSPFPGRSGTATTHRRAASRSAPLLNPITFHMMALMSCPAMISSSVPCM